MTKKLEALKKCGNDIVDRLEFFGNRNPKCPYCGEEWWELYEEGDHTVTCPSCDHDFIVRTSVRYSFSTDEQHDGTGQPTLQVWEFPDGSAVTRTWDRDKQDFTCTEGAPE